MAPTIEANPPPSALRIGVNLVLLGPRIGGMRQYVLQLIPWMVRRSSHDFLLFHTWKGQSSLAQMLRGMTLAERRRIELVLVEDHDAIYRHAGRFDVLFSPLNCLAPDLLDRPTICTLPDIQEQFYPQHFRASQLSYRADTYPRAARGATILLTISEFSKRTICQAFGVDPAKVVVTYLAPNEGLLRARADWPAGIGRPKPPFVVYPANFYPHKRHDLLLDALAMLRGRSVDCRAVLTGQPANPGIDIRREIAQRKLADSVTYLEHVPPHMLRWLYENALALAFPSEFEGFGMPLVEAQVCGCPIVATANTSIPEIAGDAALYVEPAAAAFAEGIERLLKDAPLWSSLRSAGEANAARFSVETGAVQTLAAIDEAVRRFTPPAAREPITYVIDPGSGGSALVHTLISLAYDHQDQDQVVILGCRSELVPAAQQLADNLGGVIYLPPTARRHSIYRRFIRPLRGGDMVAEGSSAAMLAELEADDSSLGIVGEVLARTAQGELRGLTYRPVKHALLQRLNCAPSCAVLQRIEGDDHAAELLARAAAGSLSFSRIGPMKVLERTVAYELVKACVSSDDVSLPGLRRRGRAVAMARATALRLAKRLPARVQSFLRAAHENVLKARRRRKAA